MSKQPRFEQLEVTKLVGISAEMSRQADRTPQLWGSFMPRRNLIENRTSNDFISMQVYSEGPQQVADPSATFKKWAAVQVNHFDNPPEGMDRYEISGGLYAVFQHHGPATDLSTVMYIFTEWLPNSEYVLDDREHFEVLPENYKALDPEAREEFWIPVRLK